jgi:hypothetical protein
MSAMNGAAAMSDDDFLNHVLWLVVDGAEAHPSTRKRAAALAQARCKASYEAAKAREERAAAAYWLRAAIARHEARSAEAVSGCTPDFPCRHCTDCDAAERAHLMLTRGRS